MFKRCQKFIGEFGGLYISPSKYDSPLCLISIHSDSFKLVSKSFSRSASKPSETYIKRPAEWAETSFLKGVD